MRRLLFICALGTGLPGCNSRPAESRSVPITVDGVKLYVPIDWGAVRPWYPRPWRNGLYVGTSGWGGFEPTLGAIELAKPLGPGLAYVADSRGKKKRKNEELLFFTLHFTFEFPKPTSLWWRLRGGMFFPYDLDRLNINYLSIAERDAPYKQLLAGLRPTDGEDVGAGWRQVREKLDGHQVALRFDAEDWSARGGSLPRHLAASLERSSSWSHYSPLKPVGWAASFRTERLPVALWRERYSTAERLFAWLRTPPHRRDSETRFIWWTDARSRPPTSTT